MGILAILLAFRKNPDNTQRQRCLAALRGKIAVSNLKGLEGKHQGHHLVLDSLKMNECELSAGRLPYSLPRSPASGRKNSHHEMYWAGVPSILSFSGWSTTPQKVT